MRKAVALAIALVFALAAPAGAADPSSGTLTSTSGEQTWMGGVLLNTNIAGICLDATVGITCDVYTLTVDAGDEGTLNVGVGITTAAAESDDFDFVVQDAEGNDVASSFNEGTVDEFDSFESADGVYRVVVWHYDTAMGATYAGSARVLRAG